MIQLIFGLLLSFLPVLELRAGLPIVLDYCLTNGLSPIPWVVLVFVLNILAIFIVFLFLDFIHVKLMKWNFYRKRVEKCLIRFQKRIDKVESKMAVWGYLALMVFVAIPLPGTGAWTGALIAWVLGLERKKSIVALSCGVLIAGLIVLFISFGLLSLFYG